MDVMVCTDVAARGEWWGWCRGMGDGDGGGEWWSGVEGSGGKLWVGVEWSGGKLRVGMEKRKEWGKERIVFDLTAIV